VPSGVAALLIAMTPFWMTGLEALLPGGDRLSRQGVFGLLIGFGGLVVLMLPQLAAGHVGSRMLLGFGALELGCLSWAVGSVYSRRTPVQVKPLMAAAIQMVIAGAALVLMGSVLGEWPAFHLTVRNGSALLYLIAVGSILAFGCYTYALQKLPISTVSLYAYINPIIAVFLGWALLREPVGWREVASLVIILGGVMVVQRARVRKGEATKSREAAVPAGKLATDS
jgi:drug/metabolite transporter (DMT)-like permease